MDDPDFLMDVDPARMGEQSAAWKAMRDWWREACRVRGICVAVRGRTEAENDPRMWGAGNLRDLVDSAKRSVAALEAILQAGPCGESPAQRTPMSAP